MKKLVALLVFGSTLAMENLHSTIKTSQPSSENNVVNKHSEDAKPEYTVTYLELQLEKSTVPEACDFIKAMNYDQAFKKLPLEEKNGIKIEALIWLNEQVNPIARIKEIEPRRKLLKKLCTTARALRSVDGKQCKEKTDLRRELLKINHELSDYMRNDKLVLPF